MYTAWQDPQYLFFVRYLICLLDFLLFHDCLSQAREIHSNSLTSFVVVEDDYHCGLIVWQGEREVNFRRS